LIELLSVAAGTVLLVFILYLVNVLNSTTITYCLSSVI